MALKTRSPFDFDAYLAAEREDLDVRHETESGETVDLDSIECRLSVAEIYRGVRFETELPDYSAIDDPSS